VCDTAEHGVIRLLSDGHMACKEIEYASPKPTDGRRPGVPEMRQHADQRDW
jgi:hypothetical protein